MCCCASTPTRHATSTPIATVGSVSPPVTSRPVARASALLRRTVKVASAGVDRLRPPVPGVVILIYHRVGGGTGLEIDLDPGVFDAQMAALAASKRVVTLGTALER